MARPKHLNGSNLDLDVSTWVLNLMDAFSYHNKTLAIVSFSAKDANLFLHNHLKSPGFNIYKVSST